MPAESASQRRFMAMALRYKKGDKTVLEGLSQEVKEKIKEVAKNMGEEDLRDFASTKEENLPERKSKVKVSKDVI